MIKYKVTFETKLRIFIAKPFIYLPLVLLPLIGGMKALRVQLWCMGMIRRIVVGNK